MLAEQVICRDPTYKVTASDSGVVESETDLLCWIDDKDGTDGEGKALAVAVGHIFIVQHVVDVGDFAIRVSNL